MEGPVLLLAAAGDGEARGKATKSRIDELVARGVDLQQIEDDFVERMVGIIAQGQADDDD